MQKFKSMVRRLQKIFNSIQYKMYLTLQELVDVIDNNDSNTTVQVWQQYIQYTNINKFNINLEFRLQN